MDNQNANGGFAPLGGNIPQNNNQLSDAEKSAVVVQPDNYVNQRTQSMVQSSRDELDEELQRYRQQQAAFEHQQKIDQAITHTKKTGIYVVIGAISVALVLGIVWVVYLVTSMSTAKPIAASNGGGSQKTEYGEIDGYKCKKESCSKVVDVDENIFIVHDGSEYYLHDKQNEQSMLTTISEQEYHEIKPFRWGDKIFAVLDPESGKSALYSITNNRQITTFSYDDFSTDMDDVNFSHMTEYADEFIIAYNNGVRVLDIVSGQEVAHGTRAAYIRDEYGFGFEDNGQIHVYYNGNRILVFENTSKLYIGYGYIFEVDANNTLKAYSDDGAIYNGQIFDEVVRKSQDSNYESVLSSDDRFVNAFDY